MQVLRCKLGHSIPGSKPSSSFHLPQRIPRAGPICCSSLANHVTFLLPSVLTHSCRAKLFSFLAIETPLDLLLLLRAPSAKPHHNPFSITLGASQCYTLSHPIRPQL